MKIKETVAKILAYPKHLLKSQTCENCSVEKLQSQDKPVPVIVIPTKGAKAAMIRDWVMAVFFGLFAGIAVHDKFLKPRNTDKLDSLIKSLDLNNDGHISKDELENVEKLITKKKKLIITIID